MATSREFERYLVLIGFSAIRLDSCNRLLREHGRVPTGGRGLHAPQIDVPAAAAILLAYLGCTRAVRAVERLSKLEIIRDDSGRSLFVTVCEILARQLDVQELRVSRLRSRARLILPGGAEIRFAGPKATTAEGRLEAEGVADGTMLSNIAAFLGGDAALAPEPDEVEDAE